MNFIMRNRFSTISLKLFYIHKHFEINWLGTCNNYISSREDTNKRRYTTIEKV